MNIRQYTYFFLPCINAAMRSERWIRWRYGIGLVCVAFLLPVMSHAGEVLDSHVAYEDGHYLVRLEMKIAAEMATVYALLTDFNNLAQLNDSIKISRVMHSNGKEHLVFVEAEGCVWFMCRRVKQVQQVTELGRGYIKSVTQPDQSDMEYGRVLWHIRQDGEFTVISYRADFVPAFFVPPLFGPYIMQERLLEEGQKTIRGIEHSARFAEEY